MMNFIGMIISTTVTTIISVAASIIGTILALALIGYVAENAPAIIEKTKYYFEVLKQKASILILKVKRFRIRELKII